MWICKKCVEENEDSFDVCWKCETDREMNQTLQSTENVLPEESFDENTDYDECPNCGTLLNGYLTVLLLQSKVDFINKNLNETKEAYCTSCSEAPLIKIAHKFKQNKNQIENRLQEIIHHIPVISCPAPVKWDYEIIDMVTSQTTSGTGFLTELSRGFNDFFGTKSNRSSKKIFRATNLCKNELRVQCVRQGGNAVISTDIDFNEVGAVSTNMLMVCMAGTAIRVTNMTNFNNKTRETMIEITELIDKLEAIAEIAE